MSTHQVKADWIGGMAFDAHVGNHTVRIDNSIKGGGTDTGPMPKPFMLIALAGCTGLDVITMLDKMRVKYSDFNLEVTGTLSEDVPKVYTHIDIIYTIKVEDADKDKVEKAVNLSEEKYCGVSQMLKKAMTIGYTINYI
ncbi:MAG: OsmC family protein [Bacteroidia bacterium]|jgi:putative redox protein